MATENTSTTTSKTERAPQSAVTKNQTQTKTEIFGDVISSYSRAQAIEDGVLVDLSGAEAINEDAAFACSLHFKAPVAVTPAVYDELFFAVRSGRHDWDEIVGDVMWLASPREPVKIGLQHVFPVVIVKTGRERLRADWRLVVSAGDAGEMVITILTQDDFLNIGS